MRSAWPTAFARSRWEKRDAQNTDMTGYKGPLMHYASGAITSMGKWTQTYGYWEARIKMASGPGTWPGLLAADRSRRAGEEHL